MGPTAAIASARRYRTRHQPPSGGPQLPQDNLLWRDPKVPLRRADAFVQLELIGPEQDGIRLPDGLPNRDRLVRERIDRTIQDSLRHLRPQLNRVVRELSTQMQTTEVRYPDHQVVDAALDGIEKHLQEFVLSALALKRWSTLGETP